MSNNGTFYIDSATELKVFCDELPKDTWIGVDTEFMRERTYYSEPCLVQLSTDTGIACVDVLAIKDIVPLKELLCRQDVVKLMHSCSQDLEIFYLLFNAIPPNIFDTQVAAAFTGRGDQVSYAALVEAICGITLHKAHTRARWCNRPLSQDEIHYAEDDVRYLPALYETLSAELEKTGHRAWFDEEMQGISNTDVHGINEQNAWQRMNALKQMAGRPLAAAKALAGWREGRAQERNKPKSWILADKVLLQIAYALPETLNELAAIDDVPEGFVKHQGNRVLSIIRQSAEHDEPEQPSRPGRPDAREKALKKELAGILDKAAEKINIPASILATRRDLTSIIHGERELPVLQGWRAEIVGNDLLAHLQSTKE
jgi:ribonuclease D